MKKHSGIHFTLREFVILIFAVMISGCTQVKSTKDSKPERPPNILFIMNDDAGAYEFGCYGNKVIKTPNIDKLAGTGVKFLTCYSTPLCTPTRVELQTGKYGFRTGVHSNEDKYGGNPEIELYSYNTIEKILKQAGYATAAAGKCYVPINDIRKSYFDEYCSWGEGLWLDDQNAKVCYHGIHDKDRNEKRIDPRTIGYTGELYADGPSRYWNPFINLNGKMMQTDESDFGPDIYSDFLIDFMKRSKDGPFYAYYPACLPHGVLAPNKDYFYARIPDPDQPDGKAVVSENKMEDYRKNIEYFDQMVGKLVAALDASGLRENTIIFVTGDNGSGPNAKNCATERGVRVPMIVNCPGLVKPGYVADDLIDYTDILPTLCDLAGAELPADDVFDGISFKPVLQGEKGAREWIFSYLRGERVLRTREWLLEENHESDYGILWYCGGNRNGIAGYTDMTRSGEPEVQQIKEKFNRILKELPAPKGLPYKDQRAIPGLENVMFK